MTYTLIQWLLIFFFYCIAGWIWESAYVSLRTRRMVNRGFLHGPWLPIYGTGAIAVLIVTLPFSGHPLSVFLAGMISATALEYLTGAVMERIFHMRYWDYSDKPCNLNGHICLSVSIGWGFFSLFLVRVLHPPVSFLVRSLPGVLPDILCVLLTVLFTVDVTRSVQSALDLRELMKKLTARYEVLNRINTSLSALTEKLGERSDQLRQHWKEQGRFHSPAVLHPVKSARSAKERWQQKLSAYRQRQSDAFADAQEKTAIALSEVEQWLLEGPSGSEQERLEAIRSALLEIQSLIHSSEIEAAARQNRDFRRAVSILDRNPSARSQKYQSAFADLKQLISDHRTKHDPS